LANYLLSKLTPNISTNSKVFPVILGFVSISLPMGYTVVLETFIFSLGTSRNGRTSQLYVENKNSQQFVH